MGPSPALHPWLFCVKPRQLLAEGTVLPLHHPTSVDARTQAREGKGFPWSHTASLCQGWGQNSGLCSLVFFQHLSLSPILARGEPVSAGETTLTGPS